MKIEAVKINGLENPIGYDFDMLLCSWKVREAKGQKAVSSTIQVSLDSKLSKILWEKSGMLDCVGEKIEIELRPCTRYYFRIMVVSDAGEKAESEIHYFETSKMDEEWEAKWIGVQGEDTHPEFSKCFSCDGIIQKARLLICGLGIFEAELNGEKVGEDLLAPFINDYKEHFQYCMYDITSLLKKENTLSVYLGDGWWRGHFGLGEPTHYERPLALLAELHLVYEDGRIERIGTDETWKYRKSFTTLSDIYNGETQDFTLPLGEWKKPEILEALGKLTARYSPSLQYMETLKVQNVISTPAGEKVLDFGQNFAGHIVCTGWIPSGVTMTLEFGEILQNGNFYHENYRNAQSRFTYISDGKHRTIRPRFTFFGFRYVKVSGLESIDPQWFEGRVIYSKMDRTGWIETGDSRINRLFLNSLWGLKSNFLDMPTDCPQRDERLGWTGDAQIFCTTAGYHMDTRAFYHKFLRDLRSDQKRNQGAVAIYLPNDFPGMSAGIWSDIAAFLPKMLYDYYGSKEMLRSHFDLMKEWVDYVYRADVARGQKNLFDFGFQFGDWLALDGATQQSTFGRTDNGYVCSLYYYASTKYVAQAARILEKPEASEYELRAEIIKKAIQDEYFTASGRLAVDTQTGYLTALKFEISPDPEKTIAALKDRLKKDLGRLKGGFVGATMMNCVLAENGMVDQAYDLLFYEGFPGWLYAVNLGATTIWERWNSVLPDGTISGTSMNSLNHYSYGSIVEFLYRHAAGIIPTEPGFKKVKIAPHPEIRMRWMKCCYDSVSGLYVSNWKIQKDGSLQFHLEIPFGCEAEVYLPEQDMMTLKSGSYDFEVKTAKNYCTLYHAETPYERLFKDEQAVAILKKYVPGVYYGTDQKDEEAMSKSLIQSRFRAALFRQPTEQYDKAIQEICKIMA